MAWSCRGFILGPDKPPKRLLTRLWSNVSNSLKRFATFSIPAPKQFKTKHNDAIFDIMVKTSWTNVKWNNLTSTICHWPPKTCLHTSAGCSTWQRDAKGIIKYNSYAFSLQWTRLSNLPGRSDKGHTRPSMPATLIGCVIPCGPCLDRSCRLSRSNPAVKRCKSTKVG